MGTKQTKVKKEEPTTAPELVEGREPTIQEEPKQSFDERTQATQPFIKDGKQVTGAEDTTEADS